MKSKKLLSISALVVSIPFAVSMIMFLYNVRYIKYCSLFGDIVKEMRYNYAILGYTFDSGTAEMYESFVKRGNLSFTALCIAILLLIALLIVFFIALKMKSIEAIQEQTAVLRNRSKNEDCETLNYCSKCGAAAPINSSFCSNCGFALTSPPIAAVTKDKNSLSLPLIIFMIVQIIGIIFGLFGGNIGGIMMMCSIIAIPLCIVLGVLTIIKAQKIKGKSGMAIGIAAVSLYGFMALIILLSFIFANIWLFGQC